MNRRNWLRWSAVIALILLPLGVHWLYLNVTSPSEIRIASGPEGGRYRVLAERLKTEMEAKLGIQVMVVPTDGSLENLSLLRNDEADLALYQRGTERILHPERNRNNDDVAFVANLYPDVVHVLVRRGTGISTLEDLRGKRVALPRRTSGDYAMTRLLLEEYGLKEGDMVSITSDYVAIRKGFADATLDAAVLAAGVQAPIYRDLIATGACQVLDIPHAKVIAEKHLSVSEYTIHAGYYGASAPPKPPKEIRTVAGPAQLLAKEDLPSGFVEELTRLVLSEDFLRKNQLRELHAGGKAFARERPGWALHTGALNYYEPELRPLINPDFVEATEGLRSLIVSALIAGFLWFRWLRKRRLRKQEHRLDRYIRKLLEIERQQLYLDQTEGSGDLVGLQTLLDDVTALRQDALGEFSAHDLNEDRATDCFIEMCHALTDKINAKILRQRIDKRFEELARSLRSDHG